MYMVSNSKAIQLVLTTVFFIALIDHVKCELFTALAHMKQLIQVEEVILSNIKNYVANQKKKIHFLKSQLIEYEDNHAKSSVDVSRYLANPLNAFLMMKRLTSDFFDIRYVMESGIDDEIARNLSRYRKILEFPTEEDLRGTAQALLRVQKTYNINVSRIANGDFGDGSQNRYQMSSHDCYLLANYSAERSDYDYAIIWFREALVRLSDTDFEWKSDIYRRLINLTLAKDDFVDALYFTTQLLKLTPEDQHMISYKLYIEDQLKDIPMPKLKEVAKLKESESTFLEPIYFDYYDELQEEQYKKLCRQEIVPSAQQLAPLRCRYVYEKSPFLKIAPLKMEEANLDPYIVVYHHVMYDIEIDILKDIAEKRMETAQVYDYDTGEYVPSTVRTSKSVFLPDKKHKYIRDISVRVEDMTGLKLTTAENLQIVNYGIGGHYDPHIDFFPDEANDKNGNRIATVLFYMSDVQKGGATVFPFTNTVLWPEKGSAAFWYNLYKSGVGDLRTKHAACPVLAGTKWVSNKWLHLGGQEFVRPCSLQRDHPENQQMEDMNSMSEDEEWIP